MLVERDGAEPLIIKGAPEDVIRLCTSTEISGGRHTGVDGRASVRRCGQASSDQWERAQGFRLKLGIASRAEPRIRRRPHWTRTRRISAFAGFAVFFLTRPKSQPWKQKALAKALSRSRKR